MGPVEKWERVEGVGVGRHACSAAERRGALGRVRGRRKRRGSQPPVHRLLGVPHEESLAGRAELHLLRDEHAVDTDLDGLLFAAQHAELAKADVPGCRPQGHIAPLWLLDGDDVYGAREGGSIDITRVES